METVEVVIKIPKEQYEKGTLIQHFGCYSRKLDTIIYEGTVLPKGHGRLIDADELISKICGNSCGCHLEECGNDNPCYSVTRISSAQTIIEADNAESEVEDADSD